MRQDVGRTSAKGKDAMSTKTLPRQEYKRLLREKTLPRDEILAWIRQAAGCLVIGVGMLKGGTGKTTSSIYIALYWAIVFDLKVCLVDTDSNSQSVETWYNLRKAEGAKVPFDLVVHDVGSSKGPDLETRITDLRDEYDVVVVDIGGGDKEAYWDLCTYANMLLLPCAPSGYETVRIPPSMKIALKAGKANENVSGLNVFVIMVKCDSRTTLPEEQRAYLEAALGAMGQDDSLAEAAFQISNATHYSRSWEIIPSIKELEEFGLLMRHLMKEVAA